MMAATYPRTSSTEQGFVVNMVVLNVHTAEKPYGLLGEKGGKGVWRWGEREVIYLSLHCHHQNDCCINLRWAAMRAIFMFQ